MPDGQFVLRIGQVVSSENVVTDAVRLQRQVGGQAAEGTVGLGFGHDRRADRVDPVGGDGGRDPGERGQGMATLRGQPGELCGRERYFADRQRRGFLPCARGGERQESQDGDGPERGSEVRMHAGNKEDRDARFNRSARDRLTRRRTPAVLPRVARKPGER